MSETIKEAVAYAMTCTISRQHSTSMQIWRIAMKRLGSGANGIEVAKEVSRQCYESDKREGQEQAPEDFDSSDWDVYGRTN